jgi:hypothetical protein
MGKPKAITHHTPGPWKFDQTTGAVSMDDGDVEALVATVNFESVSERQANADGRLIAAAPDLYAALVEAKQEMWLVARHNWTMADFKNWASVQQIDAALEKADGIQRTTPSRAEEAA